MMSEQRATQDRASLLADVAEMYYLDQKNQAEIAKRIGVTRSMVSRLLTEARESGIVEIRIHRSVQSDRELESLLIKRFGLKDASVVTIANHDTERLLRSLGAAGAQTLKRYLAPKKTLGLAWGTSISATVDAFDVSEPMNIRVVQMVGAMGARNMEYDGHDLVSRVSEKVGGEAYYLNAPFICQSAEMAKALLETKSIKETITLCRKADVALCGVGTTAPEYSSFYLAGSVSLEELNHLLQEGAIGDVCGLHFDENGRPTAEHFSERLVTIRPRDLLSIPVRVGVAGGEGKVKAILGALRSKYINVLVTDSVTSRKFVHLAKIN
jgi:DNA-binding transcriptional regulator LsrR (DeoR family)